jgi:hypothetical protein
MFDGVENPKVMLLVRARDILHERGIAQGRSNDGGRKCIYSAVIEANGRYRNWDEFGFGPFPAAFNDAPGRTMAEIDGWFDERIAEAFLA